MPPGMTIWPVASITLLADCPVSAPGPAIAAIVSPATATSQRATPCGVTTSPPRMIRSSMEPPETCGEKTCAIEGIESASRHKPVHGDTSARLEAIMLLDSERRFLAQQRVAHLATADKRAIPHVVP